MVDWLCCHCDCGVTTPSITNTDVDFLVFYKNKNIICFSTRIPRETNKKALVQIVGTYCIILSLWSCVIIIGIPIQNSTLLILVMYGSLANIV